MIYRKYCIAVPAIEFGFSMMLTIAYLLGGLSFCLCYGSRNHQYTRNTGKPDLSTREIRIELIKLQILERLNLSEPPRISRKVLRNVLMKNKLQDIRSDIADSKYGKEAIANYDDSTESLVFIPKEITYKEFSSPQMSSASMKFDLDQVMNILQELSSAHLWIYKNQQNSSKITYILYDVQSGNSSWSERILNIDKAFASTGPGWHKYNVTETIIRSSLKSNLAKMFTIGCYGCNIHPISNELNTRPFLIITVNKSHRVVRNTDGIECSTGSLFCCREKFFLSFKEIGWDEWIINPTGYAANFCRGSCDDDPSLARYLHGQIMQSLIWNRRIRRKKVQVSLCCSVSKVSSIGVISVNSTGEISITNIPNLVVESCECA